MSAAYTQAGRVADAVPLLTQALDRTMATAIVDYQALCHLSLGEAYRQTSRLEEAHALAERALGFARQYPGRGYQAYALHLLGDIAAQREPPEAEQAEAHYCQALVLAEEPSMYPLQAHCHHGLGQLYSTSRRREQARAALSTATKMYHAMAMTLWLSQAEAALAQLGAAGR